VFSSAGDLYFTDPPYGLPGQFDDPGRDLDFSGVYRLSRDGALTLLSREIGGPNGIALSPAGDTLYVSDSLGDVWMAFDLHDGVLTNPRVFFDPRSWSTLSLGAPDGIKVDASGNVFAAGLGGVHVFAPDGTHLGSIEMRKGTSNVAFGNDGSVLYITASSEIYRIQTLTLGLGFKSAIRP
jgi:gluconolactonase